MIGMSNGMNVGDNMIHGNQNQTEQQDKKDWSGDSQISFEVLVSQGSIPFHFQKVFHHVQTPLFKKMQWCFLYFATAFNSKITTWIKSKPIVS